MSKPWTIALVSTDYDLKNERQLIRTFVKSKGMIISAFEEPDFPIISNTHSHENCVKAIERADLVIVLINKRWGGNYFLDDSISITEAEYKAINVPKIVLVNRNLWDELHVYKSQKKALGTKKKNFDKSYVNTYADNINVLHFVETVQKDYEENGRSNWIHFWETIKDLEENINLILSSQTPAIIRQIFEKQLMEIKSKKTSTALSVSLGDVIEDGYYIEQDYWVRSGELGDGSTLSAKINDSLYKGASCCILGEAGAGKTTLLAKCFLENKDFSKKANYTFPLYVWLKELGKDFSFSIKDYIDICCEKYLGRKPFPFLKLSDFKFIVYLDGFDELAEKLTQRDLESFIKSEIFQWPMVITSRIQYAERYMISNDFSSKFDPIIQLKDWNEESAHKYIQNFCRIRGDDGSLHERIEFLLVKNEDLHDVLTKPLMITILLYVIEENRMQIPETIGSRSSLFNECFERLALRELEKNYMKCVCIEPRNLIIHWAFFAWSIYETRLQGNGNVRITEALEKMKSCLGDVYVKELPTTVYDTIFDTSRDIAFGAFHEQFLEYLVAYVMAYACEHKNAPYPDFLKYVMRPEINRYFRAIICQKNADVRSIIVKNITDLYSQCAGSEKNDDIAKRIHAVYHLTRLMFDGRDEQIDRLFRSEQNKAVLQSLFFGAIKAGDMKREREFYDLLLNDKEYRDANLGYHLAYYGEIGRQDELPYNDDGTSDWGGSLRALQTHFKRQDDAHKYLLRIDLLTIRQFMEKRRAVGPMTEEIMLEVERAVHGIQNVSEEFRTLLEREMEEVKRTYEKFV